ncbi:TIGR02680 family protein [Nocardiopsis potens]|uniref:TIGR02680 family protein n=1 Tax=Nocardiopsis potens TaxID=1246458 RepID=UPI00034974B4|nr:TIGR02680 family protein [Nocardiopsis potens]
MTQIPIEPALPGPADGLPVPVRERWQPLRLGLVDMFYYENEEFRFRDGRLLLRGNNGTGKSKVLALSLPFLLDGDLSARRVEPDGDPKKRMEWNLLLGGEHEHPERLGYTWIEFGRRAEDGTPEFRTLGCGLKAVAGRGIARHWFFVTRQRIGLPGEHGLRLVDAARTALTHDRLDEALGGLGRTYRTARDYRRAVDEELFGLGEERYRALVELLIRLRQPQLSKRPDEAALSRALTEALPPMDQAVVADAADAFRSLDEERDELGAMVDAERAAARFLEHYRGYACVAARRRARPPREKNSAYEKLNEALRAANVQHEQARHKVEAADTELKKQHERAVRLDAEEKALRAAPEMRSADALEQAAREARSTEARRAAAVQDSDRASGELTHVERRLADAEARGTGAAQVLETALSTARNRAQDADIAEEHRASVEPHAGTAPPNGGLDAARRAAEALTGRRERAITHVEGVLAAAEEAAALHRSAEERLVEADEQLVEREERVSAARAGVDRASAELVSAVREHVSACSELRPAAPEGLLDRLQDWTGRLDGPNPARVEVEEEARRAGGLLAESTARLRLDRNALARDRDGLQAELDRLRGGGQSAPPAPHTREPGAREDRLGAPLWRLVDFRDGVPEAERAGVEAALEASGLLDAWVAPDGSVEDGATGDTVLVPGAAVPGRSLRALLRPAIDAGDPRASAVTSETVDRVLGSIGAAEHGLGGPRDDRATWVDARGSFRVGALRGRWAKEEAEYLGEGAREAARRARIARVEAELSEAGAELARLDAELELLAGRKRTLDRELAGFPGDEGLRSAHAGFGEASRLLARAREQREEVAGKAAQHAREARRAQEELEREADDLRLPAEAAALRRMRGALVDYRISLEALWPAVRERRDAEADAHGRREDAERYRGHLRELADRAETAAEEAATAQERHTTLQETVGAAVADLQARLAANEDARRECRGLQEAARSAHSTAVEDRGRAEGRIEQLTADIGTAAADRAEAVAALRRFTATGLLSVALPELEAPSAGEEWAPRPAVELARSVDTVLADVDDSDNAWERVQKRLSAELNTLRDALSARGHRADAQSLEDGMVVHVVFQGREHGVPELADVLAREVEERKRILSAREREILENHLITEVAGTLQELIVAAERQVAEMNTELERRPTSTGMQLQLVWRPSRKNAPPGLNAARDRLRQDSDAWSPEDREAVGGFLQAQIDRVRSADQGGGTWLEHLTEALDYRSWYEFGVERYQHGRWQSATGPASGGERVLSMSIPLFAAASSHYASAGDPNAPRLITLDEAFAGVDDDSRAKCLGLLASFDLDVVMTSEREWGCYPEVPGLAIAQLSRMDGVPAVLVTRWEWDGDRRARGPEPGTRPPDEPPGGTAGGQEPLWP